ncbi:hypothetical protein IC229_21250 [Spirosoma sp. BT702]|uniref:Dystroglycan-type cadherin-like domain-containing protein n=1 Tax=Spirosoma profusum TaxID=2771354 RepID=A0A926XZK9_9BACT|nr:putative Ig domain-containing protein [Spirosoma profusum]MBD2703186.1 hypothetical protein [Spirosoma profusum]
MLNTTTLFYSYSINGRHQPIVKRLRSIARPDRRWLFVLILLLTGLTAQAQKTWTGATSDWNTATNWSPTGVPIATDDVVIPSAPANKPILSTTAVAYSVEVQSGASLTITAAGSLTINGSKEVGGNFGSGTTAFYNAGSVDNSGQLIIGSTGDVGSYGLWNAATFTNQTGGQISIDRSSQAGLVNDVTFDNYARIAIGANAGVGNTGLLIDSGTFNNQIGGEVTIDNASSRGVYGNGGSFFNYAKITIEIYDNVGSIALQSNAFPFSNSGCSAIIVANAPIDLMFSFSNSGTIIESASGNSGIGNNTGIVQNLNGGTFSVESGNPAITTPGNIWKGCTSTDWNTASNWSKGAVPTATDNVVIPSGPTNQPVLSTTAVGYTVEVQSGASLTITAAGSLTLNGARYVYNNSVTTVFYNDGLVDNNGQLIIGSKPLVGGFNDFRHYGLWNNALFKNHTGGEIMIDRTYYGGLENNGGTFTNEARLIIGANALAGSYGIKNDATFDNKTSGDILIDKAGQLVNNSGTFTNYARITLGAASGGEQLSIANYEGTVNNSGCSALINIVANAYIRNMANFTNSGTIIENASGNSSISTNTGIVQNLNGGTFNVGSGPNAAITTTGKLWLGCTSTDWNTASNWLNGTLPTAIDNVVIPASLANKPILSTTAVVNSVEVISGASLTITAAGSLTLNGSKAPQGNTTTAAFHNAGHVDNSGRMIISSTATGRNFGLDNIGMFTNHVGGEITIDRSTLIGLFNREGSTLTNYARITIGAIAAVGNYSISNFGLFNNSGCSALLNVAPNIFIENGIFSNSGTIIENFGIYSQISNNTGIVQNLNGGTFDVGSGPNQPLSLSVTNATTCSPTNGAITISGVHASTTYTISYTVNGVSATVSPNPSSDASGQLTVSYLTPGNYALTLGGSCVPLPLSLSASLSGPVSPTASLSPSSATLTCASPSVTLTAGGGTSYTLTGGSGTQTNTTGQFVVSQPATYTVTLTNAGGCTATASTVVSQDITPPTVSINPGSATITCASPTVSLSAVGVGTYRWSTGATTASISVTAGNTYSVTLTGANGCTAVASRQVSQDTAPPAASINPSTGTPTGTTLTCSSPLASLSAVGVGTYRWSTGATTASISVSLATTYSLTVTGVNGCSATATITVSQDQTPPSVAISPASATLSCNNPVASLSAVGVGTYRWSSGATTSSISVSLANTYSVTLTGANGCTVTASATVTYQNCAPTVANAISPKSATVGNAFSYTIPATTFTDAETPNSLTLSVAGLPAGLSFVSPNTITGVPSTTLGTPFNVTVTATDPGGLSVATSFGLNVQSRGFAVTGVTMLDCNHIGYFERRINFTVSFEGTNGQPISLSVVNEVPGITIYEPYQLNLFTDNPVIVLKACQQGTPGEASFSYNWLANCANGSPRVANPIPPQSATVGQVFSYTIPATTFTDAETPNSLTLSVVGLPAGLSFVAPNRIMGTVSASASSFYSVTVTASDAGGSSVSTIWPMSVVGSGGCVSMYSVKAGDWSDGSVWSCGRVPVSSDVVTLNHGVNLPASYQGQALRVMYTPTGRLILGMGSKLKLGSY